MGYLSTILIRICAEMLLIIVEKCCVSFFIFHMSNMKDEYYDFMKPKPHISYILMNVYHEISHIKYMNIHSLLFIKSTFRPLQEVHSTTIQFTQSTAQVASIEAHCGLALCSQCIWIHQPGRWPECSVYLGCLQHCVCFFAWSQQMLYYYRS